MSNTQENKSNNMEKENEPYDCSTTLKVNWKVRAQKAEEERDRLKKDLNRVLGDFTRCAEKCDELQELLDPDHEYEGMKFIYKMSWYDSRRHTVSHTDMYFARECDTRWGHPNELCRITVIAVREDDQRWEMAKDCSEKAEQLAREGAGAGAGACAVDALHQRRRTVKLTKNEKEGWKW